MEEAAIYQDTSFALAAAGVFGQAGLLHFLTSGHRSMNAIATYVELLRDGDLSMRRSARGLRPAQLPRRLRRSDSVSIDTLWQTRAPCARRLLAV